MGDVRICVSGDQTTVRWDSVQHTFRTEVFGWGSNFGMQPLILGSNFGQFLTVDVLVSSLLALEFELRDSEIEKLFNYREHVRKVHGKIYFEFDLHRGWILFPDQTTLFIGPTTCDSDGSAPEQTPIGRAALGERLYRELIDPVYGPHTKMFAQGFWGELSDLGVDQTRGRLDVDAIADWYFADTPLRVS